MLESITDKQRIIIAGSEGKEQVFEIIEKVLKHAGKAYIGFNSDESNVSITDASIAIIVCSDDHLLDFNHHIALVTAVKENGSTDFESYVKQYEKMLDMSPKAGCVIYNVEDSASALIGKKERTDVMRLEYSTPDILEKNGIRSVKIDQEYLPTDKLEKYNLTYLKGAYTLLKRIGISEHKFIDALS